MRVVLDALIAAFAQRQMGQGAGVPEPPTNTAPGLRATIFSTCAVTELSVRA